MSGDFSEDDEEPESQGNGEDGDVELDTETMELFPFDLVTRVGEFTGTDDGGFEFAELVQTRDN